MEITGYKKVNYNQLQGLIKNAKDNNKSDAELAVALRVETTQTVKNAMQKDKQKVSDKILTSLISIVGLEGVVVWDKGQRNYFVKSK